MNKDEKFIFNYSAKQQKEIEQIREKYIPKKENTLDKMRRLDEKVSRKAAIITISEGMFGTLFLGIGMSCTMVWQSTMFIPGIFIGIIGLIGIGITFPLYNRIVKIERSKIAEQIILLSSEFENEPMIHKRDSK